MVFGLGHNNFGEATFPAGGLWAAILWFTESSSRLVMGNISKSVPIKEKFDDN